MPMTFHLSDDELARITHWEQEQDRKHIENSRRQERRSLREGHGQERHSILRSHWWFSYLLLYTQQPGHVGKCQAQQRRHARLDRQSSLVVSRQCFFRSRGRQEPGGVPVIDHTKATASCIVSSYPAAQTDLAVNRDAFHYQKISTHESRLPAPCRCSRKASVELHTCVAAIPFSDALQP